VEEGEKERKRREKRKRTSRSPLISSTKREDALIILRLSTELTSTGAEGGKKKGRREGKREIADVRPRTPTASFYFLLKTFLGTGGR